MTLDRTLKRIINQVRLKFGLTEAQVIEIFESQFDFMRQTIEAIDFRSVTKEEELDGIKCNFNIPGLFKLYINKNRLLKLNNKEE